MIKQKLFFFLLFLYTTNLILAQENNRLIGTIQLSDKSLISYKINFIINSDNTISGKSVTDFSGAHTTESQIKGSISNDKKLISFSEVKNISTKSNYASSDFCYVHIKNAKIRLRNNKSIIQGHFYGRFDNNELCAEGDIYLVGEEYMFKKLSKIEKKIPKKHKDKFNTEKAKRTSQMTILSEGETMKITSSSKTVILNIWDDGKNDGDLISVFLNGKKILDNFEISDKIKSIEIPVSNSTIIEVLAENEGELPPNSARFSITENDQTTKLKTKLKKGKKATIKIGL